MKLLLCSEGFSTREIVDACVELVGKPQNEIKIAIINEGYSVESGDKRWVLDNLNSAAEHFPADLDIVNLLALDLEEVKRRLSDADVIYVIGGHTDYLMHVFQKTGFDTLLPSLLESKVYVGSSAGSMVIGKRLSTEAYKKIYGEDGDYGVTEYMGMVNLAIKPHMDSVHFPYNRPEILNEVVEDINFPVYGLRDDCALVVTDGVISIVGSTPYIIK